MSTDTKFGLSDLKNKIIQIVLKLYSYAQRAWREASQAHYNFDMLKGQEGRHFNKDYETEIYCGCTQDTLRESDFHPQHS